MSSSQQLFKVADIASQLGVTVGRVYQMIAAGLVPAVRVGGSIRVPRAAWEAWLGRQTQEALQGLRRGAGG